MRARSSASARFLLLAAITTTVACGLAFSPGEYSEPTVDAPETGVAPPIADTGTPPDAEAGAIDAGPPGKQVLLVGGRRPSLPNEAASVFVAETMRVPISSTGGIGPITFDSAPPAAAGYARVLRLDPNPLVLQRDSNTAYRADFTDGRLTTDWSTLAVRGGAVENFQRGWLTDAGLLSAGGFTMSNNTATSNVYRALFNFGDGGIDGWTMLTPKITRARGDVVLYRHNNFLYAIGGRENTGFSSPGRDTVEVALIGSDGLPAAFEATEPLLNPTSMAAHNVYVPPVTSGKGYLFVVGGQTTANPSAITDVVLAAKINETSGKLDKWIAAPKLPTTLTSAAVIVIDNNLFVFGGAISQTELSDSILSLAINPDGSLGTEWRAVGKLPGPRSNLAVMEIVP